MVFHQQWVHNDFGDLGHKVIESSSCDQYSGEQNISVVDYSDDDFRDNNFGFML